MRMKSGRLAVIAVALLTATASTASAAPATASGPAALALAGVVVLYSPLLTADEREAVRVAAVEPEQHPGRDGEVKGQVGDAEQAREAGERLNGALHVGLGEEIQRAFKRDEPVGVS